MRRIARFVLGVVIAGCIVATAGYSNGRGQASSTGTTPASTESPTQSATAASTLPSMSPVAADLFTRLNALRVSLNLTPCLYSPVLSAAAADQAQWMVTTGLVTHIRPDGSTPAQRAQNAAYTEPWTVSEIIYMGQIATPDNAWKFWLTSPVHYAELTRADRREAGIGIARSDTFGTAFVVDFGGFNLPPTPVPLATPGGTYVIQPGDTLYRIALRFGVPLDQLAAANHLRLTDVIFVGQVIVIPAPATGSCRPSSGVPSTPCPTVR